VFIQIAGKAAEGTYLTFSPDPAKIPTAKAFLENYSKKYGVPGPYSIYAYDAANILLSAVKEAGTAEGKAVAEKFRARSFSGAIGDITFDHKGDVTAPPYVVWTVRDGRFEEYWKP
jgi:branched-chain amino acid transport system substrate-binding protein